MLTVTTGEKRNVKVNMKQLSNPRPVVGGIYGDRSGSSLVVLNVDGNKALLEYANGTITTVDVNNWQLLHPESAAY
jgi:hypothetical protein